MTMKKKFKSDAFEAIHETAMALRSVGAIDKATMREFDEACIVKTPIYEPTQIKKIREEAKVSQPIFAMYLNTSESTVQKWEAGTKKPSGMALKLLDIVRKHGLAVLA
ncbi:DNA-binding transcriptional regulator [Burkholderiaceae bacterium]|jgi:putative transcriptional regulator|nr:DNA-binding transcriptional regulator [Burkholderiaceae bacterium]MDB4136461.1 DNA-binding transcriptional regulator [Burkholderiaceae bacterium]